MMRWVGQGLRGGKDQECSWLIWVFLAFCKRGQKGTILVGSNGHVEGFWGLFYDMWFLWGSSFWQVEAVQGFFCCFFWWGCQLGVKLDLKFWGLRFVPRADCIVLDGGRWLVFCGIWTASPLKKAEYLSWATEIRGTYFWVFASRLELRLWTLNHGINNCLFQYCAVWFGYVERKNRALMNFPSFFYVHFLVLSLLLSF